MALPRINYETHELEIPHIDTKINFRPMTGHEEKILLKAKEEDKRSSHIDAIRQVLASCCLDDDVKIDDLPMYGVEYLFVKLRGLSISNKMEQTYRDAEDDELYTFEIDIEDIEVLASTNNDYVTVGDDIGIHLDYPPLALYLDEGFYRASDSEVLRYIMKYCVKAVYQGDKSFDMRKESDEEIDKFVDQLPLSALEQVQKFFMSAPSLHYKIEYANSKGTEREIVLSTLDDFFTLA